MGVCGFDVSPYPQAMGTLTMGELGVSIF